MSKNFDFFNAILSELLPEGLNITGRAYMNNNGDTHHFEVKDGKFVEEFGSGFYDEATNLAFDIL